MQGVLYLILTNSRISSIFRNILAYFSIFLFIMFVVFVSASINKYISNTMSLTIVGPDGVGFTEEVSEEFSQTITVKKGDTLNTILASQSLSKNDIMQIIQVVKDQNGSQPLKIGQVITFDYEIKILDNDTEDLASETRVLNKITIVIDKLKSLEIIRVNDNFVAKSTTIPLNKLIAKSSIVINSNFMSALKSLGLSSNSIIELINAYSYQIDFQRQIQNGDTVTVITEKFTTQDGKFSHHGKILFVSLNLSGSEYNIYRYSHDNSEHNQAFFSEDGKSAKRSLLRTPIKIVRVSSHYGNRKHPILGYTKMHKGVDFSAPTGTPIYAAGNGVITEIGWKSGYGRFIQIKHSPTLSTAYAHASKFAKNLKVGSPVKQGQVVAFVGSTGRARGAHLHYEVKINGKNVNPMSVKTTPGVELTGKKLEKFKQFKNHIKSLNAKLNDQVEIAANSGSSSLN